MTDTVYTASMSVAAATYAQAIEKAGPEFDKVWGNGNWFVIRCEAFAYQNIAFTVLYWRWDIEIGWKGLVSTH